jgi:enoyl-CoA hydratase/carnithine racemase
MQYQDLLVDIDNSVARLMLNRPKQLNAMSARMLTEPIRAAGDIAASQARAVVLSMRPSCGRSRRRVLDPGDRPRNLTRLGGIDRLVREVGAARTREFVMTGRPFSADERLLSGIVNQVVPSNQVAAAATELAESVACKSQFVVRATKAHVAEILAGDHSRDDALTAAESVADPESAYLRDEYLAKVSRK